MLCAYFYSQYLGQGAGFCPHSRILTRVSCHVINVFLLRSSADECSSRLVPQVDPELHFPINLPLCFHLPSLLILLQSFTVILKNLTRLGFSQRPASLLLWTLQRASLIEAGTWASSCSSAATDNWTRHSQITLLCPSLTLCFFLSSSNPLCALFCFTSCSNHTGPPLPLTVRLSLSLRWHPWDVYLLRLVSLVGL